MQKVLSSLVLFVLAALPMVLAQTPRTPAPATGGITQDQMDRELNRQKELQELKFKALEDKLEGKLKELELREKTLDSRADWLNYNIVWLTLLVAVFGIALPYFLTQQYRQQLKQQIENNRKEMEAAKAAIEADIRQIDQSKQQFEAEKQRVEQLLQTSRQTSKAELEEIRKLRAETEAIAKDAKAELAGIQTTRQQAEKTYADLQKLRPDEKATPEQQREIKELSQTSDEKQRLFGLALQAEQAENWQQALQHWESLTVIEPTNHRAWFGAAYATGQLADLNPDPEQKKGLWQQAIEKYKESIKHKPDYQEAWYNWGVSLGELADLNLAPEQKKGLKQQAIEKYQKAIKLKPDDHQAWSNWGVALERLADLNLDPEQKKGLWQQATEKHQEAIKHKSDDHQPSYNWGVSLDKLAHLNPDPEQKVSLWQQAIEKYQEAIKNKPDLHKAWSNLTSAYIHMYLLTHQKEWLTKAIEAGLKTVELQPGESYNLACAYALDQNEAEAKRWLLNAKQHGTLPNCEHLKAERDLDSLRDKEWFVALLAEHCA